MANAQVCCPSCWSWYPASKSMCRRCKIPLMTSTGHSMGGPQMPQASPMAVAGPPPMGYGLVGHGGQAVMAARTPGYMAGAPRQVGINWVTVARSFTVVSTVLVAGLLTLAALAPGVSGFTMERGSAVSLSTALFMAAAIVLAVGLFITWLTRFMVAQVLLLLIAVLEVLRTVTVPAAGYTSAFRAGMLFGAGIDVLYALTLVMCLAHPPSKRLYR